MYLDLAKADISVAKILLEPKNNPTNDEMITDAAAYHVQQGIEKLLKYILHDLNGIDDSSKSFRTHSITSLISKVEDETNVKVPDELKMVSELLTSWESESRYGGDISATEKQIKNCINIFEEFIENLV